MPLKWLVAVSLLGVLTFGVVSASSLGTFESIVLGGGASARTPCTVETVEFRSDGTVLHDLLGLLTGVDEIRLHGLDGDCAGSHPIVVVYGDANVLDGTTETVALSRTPLDELLSGKTSVIQAIDVSDELNQLLDLTDEPTEVRVAFCPEVSPCMP